MNATETIHNIIVCSIQAYTSTLVGHWKFNSNSMSGFHFGVYILIRRRLRDTFYAEYMFSAYHAVEMMHMFDVLCYILVVCLHQQQSVVKFTNISKFDCWFVIGKSVQECTVSFKKQPALTKVIEMLFDPSRNWFAIIKILLSYVGK